MIRIDYVSIANKIIDKHYSNNTLNPEQVQWYVATDFYVLIKEMQQFLDDLCDQVEGIERMEDEGT